MKIEKKHNQIIINYHYIENPIKGSYSSHPCTLEEFERQIRYLSENYEIVDIETLYKRAQSGGPRSCAVTFDDGLRSQFENAVPILQKYDATATFFIISGVFEGFLPATHKNHILLSEHDTNHLIDRANVFFEKNKLEKFKISKEKRITNKRKLRDDIPTANLKETINILPSEKADVLLDWLLKDTGLNGIILAKDLFMGKEEVKTLHDQGFIIGGHTHHHIALDTQPDDIVREEITKVLESLKEITSEDVRIFSYPHGGISEFAASEIKEKGITHALINSLGPVTKETDAYKIPRFDTKDLAIYLDKN
ncbi:MAG: polysaccharide deacetylase family protein [Parcubacteria group bacterium]|nr:polysaccharide deacetylase family protein [Parcubacteria group bacterium]